MPDIEAFFVKNTDTLVETFIFEPPADLVLAANEELISRFISQSEFDNLKDPNSGRFRLYLQVGLLHQSRP